MFRLCTVRGTAGLVLLRLLLPPPRTEASKPLPSSGGFSTIGGLLSATPWARLPDCNSAEPGQCLETNPRRKSPYQDFFMLWKDGDSSTPVLKQAQAEYVKLN
jgi:hypothetical protein